MSGNGAGPISVVIPTKDRGAGVVRTVRSLLAGDRRDFEIVVVDQSKDDASARALEALGDDCRVRYFRTEARGVSIARNFGVREARGDVIAMIDDDCEASAGWLREMCAVLESDTRIGVVFSNVLSGDHDSAAGFIPAYVRDEPLVVRDVAERHKVEGMGAGMAFRRSVWERLGGFDPALGASAPFRSAEDTDFALRALCFGFSVCETPRTHVVHHGFRTWRQGEELIRSYMIGVGATYAKQFKCGRWSALRPLGALFLRWAFAKPVIRLGRRPSRGLRLRGFLHGFRGGLAFPVDRARIQFRREPL